MARDLNNTFKGEKGKQTNQPVYLYTIEDYDGADNDLNYVNYPTEITFDSVTYTRMPIKHDFVSENNDGNIDTVKVTVSNISRAMGIKLESYDALRGKKVKIKLVWANQLDDADSYIEDIFYIKSVDVNQKDAVFTLKSKFDLNQINLPLDNYNRDLCRWKTFKGTECGYSGEETTCNRTKQRCIELNNIERFGAFPGIPRTDIYIR